ncbi:MAG TPA: LrgB family protein [Syntrophomonadaceae bacterium]|nr:LrgB family protein [Syntrophomonadaceae bacterium]
MELLLNSPILGIILSVFTFQIGILIFRRINFMLLHPFIISVLLIIPILLIFNIPLGSYMIGGDLITFFLGPATVVLAIPLYNEIKTLKKHYIPILVSVITGSTIAIVSVILIGQILNLSPALIVTLIPKSITNPIGIELSKQLGGDPAITVASIVFTGLLGAIVASFTCRWLGIKNPMAIGLALGTSAHAMGTSRALELGETEGAMAGLAIGLAGLATVLLAPIFVHWLM